nr:hypothetical protein [Tessaracoccus coleopterorum]
MRHTLRETWSGLRRNLAMTIAVIVTMAVSLSLLGAGVLTALEVNLAKSSLYGKIEISVFLCTENTKGGRCTPDKGPPRPNGPRSSRPWRRTRRSVR